MIELIIENKNKMFLNLKTIILKTNQNQYYIKLNYYKLFNLSSKYLFFNSSVVI